MLWQTLAVAVLVTVAGFIKRQITDDACITHQKNENKKKIELKEKVASEVHYFNDAPFKLMGRPLFPAGEDSTRLCQGN